MAGVWPNTHTLADEQVSLLNSASALINLWAGPQWEASWPEELIAQHAQRAALLAQEQVNRRWDMVELMYAARIALLTSCRSRTKSFVSLNSGLRN